MEKRDLGLWICCGDVGEEECGANWSGTDGLLLGDEQSIVSVVPP